MSIVRMNPIVLGVPCTYCRKAGFYLKERPMPDDLLSAKNAFNHYRNSRLKDGVIVVCQWCLVPMNISYLLPRWVTIFNYHTGEKV